MIDAFKKIHITFCILRQHCFYLVFSIFNSTNFHIVFIVLEFPSLLILASLIEKNLEFLKPGSITHIQLPWTQILFLVYLTSHINGNRSHLADPEFPPCPTWTRACSLLMQSGKWMKTDTNKTLLYQISSTWIFVTKIRRNVPFTC